jgi:hypothetical protein
MPEGGYIDNKVLFDGTDQNQIETWIKYDKSLSPWIEALIKELGIK